MKTTRSYWFALLLLQAAALILCGCFRWQYDVTVRGIAFNKVRIEDNGLVIGQLKEDTIIGGRPCKRGWVHVLPNGALVGFTASRDMDLGRLLIPADTWVFQGKDGVVTVCAFPRDTEVQGHLCSGSGGPEGAEVAFYPDGALKEFFLTRDTLIQGIPCKASIYESIQLYEDGRLKACTLSEDIVRDGQAHRKGVRLRLDRGGHIAR